MNMLHSITRPFRKLDTSAVEAALSDYEQSQRQVAVRARALRMDVTCGDVCETAKKVASILSSAAHTTGRTLRHIWQQTVDEPLSDEMNQLLGKLE